LRSQRLPVYSREALVQILEVEAMVHSAGRFRRPKMLTTNRVHPD